MSIIYAHINKRQGGFDDRLSYLRELAPRSPTHQTSLRCPSKSGKGGDAMTSITRMLIATLVFSLLVSADADAQQAEKIPKIGFLSGGSPGSPFIEAFETGLRDLGWVKGQNVAIEYRYAEGKAVQPGRSVTDQTGNIGNTW